MKKLQLWDYNKAIDVRYCKTTSHYFLGMDGATTTQFYYGNTQSLFRSRVDYELRKRIIKDYHRKNMEC